MGSLGLPDFKEQDCYVCPEASLYFCCQSSVLHPASLWAAMVAEEGSGTPPQAACAPQPWSSSQAP